MPLDSDFLKFNGFGENVTWSMYNNDHPTKNDIELLRETLFWAAKNKLILTFHWNNDDSVHYLLDALEEVNTMYPISTLRWSIAHLNDASKQTLVRMQVLGVGWHLQNYFYYRGRDFIQKRGLQISKKIPLIKTALALGIKVSAGTDAHRVMSYNSSYIAGVIAFLTLIISDRNACKAGLYLGADKALILQLVR